MLSPEERAEIQKDFERCQRVEFVIRGQVHKIDVAKTSYEIGKAVAIYAETDDIGRMTAVAEWMNAEFGLDDATCAEAFLLMQVSDDLYTRLKKNLDAIRNSYAFTEPTPSSSPAGNSTCSTPTSSD